MTGCAGPPQLPAIQKPGPLQVLTYLLIQSFPLPSSMLSLVPDKYNKDRYDYKYGSKHGHDKSNEPYVNGAYEYKSDTYYPGHHQVITISTGWLSAYMDEYLIGHLCCCDDWQKGQELRQAFVDVCIPAHDIH